MVRQQPSWIQLTGGQELPLHNPPISDHPLVYATVTLTTPLPWDQIGHANNVVAMAAINNELFAATIDDRLWWRDPVGTNVNWDHIGHANNVVAMTAINNKLFAATSDSRLWWRDPVR
jgi:hypothetical protein